METDPNSFILFLSILWFFIYWILGGVFFALLTILRLGRIRKVRFSCLFTLLAAACGYGAARFGLAYGEEAIQVCLAEADSKAETISALFGCGFAGILGSFLIGAAVLTFVGLFLMMVSKSKSKPWIILEQPEEPDEPETKSNSKYF